VRRPRVVEAGETWRERGSETWRERGSETWRERGTHTWREIASPWSAHMHLNCPCPPCVSAAYSAATAYWQLAAKRLVPCAY
jgi:hypothetical protein